MSDLINRQAAIDATWFEPSYTDPLNVLTEVRDMLKALPSAQPEHTVTHSCDSERTETHDLVSRRAADSTPAQQNTRIFQGIIVEYPSISTNPEYEGKPYFSIKYTEDGQDFIGYGTYKSDVLSEYLKQYFMPSAQPEQIARDIATIIENEQDMRVILKNAEHTETHEWILCSERMPEEHEWMGTKRFGTTISDEVYVTFENPKGERFCKHLSFQNGKLSGFDQSTIDAVYKGSKPIAWMPLPKPYAERKEDASSR